MKKKRPTVKPVKAWAMVDPENMQILSYRIYEKKERNGGRGSVTDGWITIPVKIIPLRKPKRKGK